MTKLATEMAFINPKKMVRVFADLYIDPKKTINKKIDTLYQQIGKAYVENNLEIIPELIDEVETKRKELKDTDKNSNNVANIYELTEKLSEYILDHFTDKIQGPINEQVMPLLSQVMGHTLTKQIGEVESLLLLVTPQLRTILLNCMVTGFMFYKLIQTHGMKIVTRTEKITQEELDRIYKMSQESQEEVMRIIFGNNKNLLGVLENDETRH